jgi:acyl-coenzyme A thioesterase PaaI-like protein
VIEPEPPLAKNHPLGYKCKATLRRRKAAAGPALHRPGLSLPQPLKTLLSRKASLMGEERILLPRIEGYDCFGCGTNNPIGLRMTFYRQGDAVCSDVVLKRHHVGWQNMAHGGIISTLLDEVMAWAVIYLKRSFSVTRRMTVRYQAPVPVEVPLTVRGSIAEECAAHTCRTAGVLLNGDGKALATGEAEFVLLGAERLTAIPAEVKREMAKLFARLQSELP